MMRSTRYECRFSLKLLVSAAPFAWQGAAVLAAAEQSGHKVELDCKIVSSTPGFNYKYWIVKISKVNGDSLRQTIKAVGETAHFRDLDPGIYLLCLTGGDSNGRCESVDLNPQDDRSHCRIKMQLGTPSSPINSIAGHTISLAQLRVSKEAQIEMSRADDAALPGNMEQMYHHLKRALYIFPNYPRALNNMGVYYYRLKDMASSIRFLRKATEVDPDFFPAWANLGSSILATGGFN